MLTSRRDLSALDAFVLGVEQTCDTIRSANLKRDELPSTAQIVRVVMDELLGRFPQLVLYKGMLADSLKSLFDLAAAERSRGFWGLGGPARSERSEAQRRFKAIVADMRGDLT